MDDADKQDENRNGYEWLKPTQFKPGESGNPGGRPKGSRSITKIIRQLLDDGMDGHDIAEALAKSGLKHALKGDYRYWKEIVERTDGKVPDHVTGDGTLKVIIEYARGPSNNPDAAHGPAPSDE